MAKPATRIRVLEVALLLAFAVVIGRAAQVQVVQRDKWQAEAARTRTVLEALPARRGTIYDRNREALAIARDFYWVGIAPNEVRDTARVTREAIRALRADPAVIRRAFRPGGRWVHLQGPFTATQVEELRRTRGVYLTPLYRRTYPSTGLARPVIGALDAETGRGISGLERMLDSLLAGVPGEQLFLRDRAGRTYESPERRVRAPVDGHEVTLTLDAELQSIAETGLADAVREMRADGGDVVFLDPRTGEFLALVSRTAQGAAATASVFTNPFEPGSTAKLFTAAALLVHQRVDSTRTVMVERAPYVIPGRGRPIEDATVKPGEYTLAHAIEVSSNVATVKFGQLLRPEEHYDMLRDFGFGSPTGIEFPSEASGTLSPPHRWKPADHGPSVSMGYGMDVTPIQLALAYAAIANDGVMPVPTLVKEIRDPAGRVVYRHRPDTVRRVVPVEVARALRRFLTMAAGEEGTGGAAQLAGYRVAGKTGTSRRLVDGRYTSTYVSSFAGIFPADDPQLVVIVKIDNPRGGAFYGGLTAAPLTRWMLEQALQARQGAETRGRLARGDEGGPPTRPAPRREPRQAPVVVLLPVADQADEEPSRVVVPDVAGQTVREAALALHRRGFRVRTQGTGVVVRSSPAAGAERAAGSVIDLITTRP